MTRIANPETLTVLRKKAGADDGKKTERTRKAALKGLAVFIGAMAVLTAANGALTELSVAVVTKTSPQRGSLERNISADGTLVPGEETAVWADKTFRVAEVYVSAGDTVEATDSLLRYDLEQVAQSLEEAKNALKKLENNRDSSLIENATAPDTSVSDALQKLERQREDFESTVETQDRKIAEAEAAITEAEQAAKDALDEYEEAKTQTYSDAVASAQEALTKAEQSLINAQYSYDQTILSAQQSEANAQNSLSAAMAEGDSAKIASAELALKIAQTSAAANIEKAMQSVNQAQSDYSKASKALKEVDIESQTASKKTAYESALTQLKTKQTALETAKKDRETAIKNAQRTLDDAQASYDKALTQASVTAKNSEVSQQKSSISLENTNMDIEAKAKEVAQIQAIYDAGGIVSCGVSGYVTTINAQRNAIPQASTPLALISGGETGLKLTVNVSSDNAEYMSVGDEVTLSFADNSFGRYYISEINAVSGNSQIKQVVVYVTGGGGKANESARLRFSKRSESYDAIVPIAALRQDSDGYYVYALRQAEDSLGSRTTIERIDVTLLDQDSTRVAVSGAIGRNDALVERSDRSLSDGDRVRVEQ